MKLSRWICSTGICTALFLNSLVGQAPVIVVDEAGGPGSSFQDLPPAVAAAPDGAVLMVRPGNYTPFTLGGKSLSVIGEDSGVVLNRPGALTLLIASIGPSNRVVIRNIRVASFVGFLFIVRNSAGPVIFEDVQFEPAAFGAHRVQLENSSNVQFHGCRLGDPASAYSNAGTVARITATDSVLQISDTTIAGLRGVPAQTGTGGVGTPALSLFRSRIVAVASNLVGGAGGEGCGSVGCSMSSGPGGPAAEVDDGSVLVALGTPITGGRGVDQFMSPGGSTVAASAGGDGLVMMATASVFAEGAAVSGGAGGAPAGMPGTPVVNLGGMLQLDPAATPSSARIEGSQSIGALATLELDAAPGSAALLLVSGSGPLQPLYPLALGSFLSGFSLSVGPLVVPPTGNLQLPIQVPVPVGNALFVQFATIDPVTSGLWVTNSVTLLVEP